MSAQSTEKRSENLTRKKDEKSCMKKISRALQGIMDKGRDTPDKIQTSQAKKQALSWSKLASNTQFITCSEYCARGFLKWSSNILRA